MNQTVTKTVNRSDEQFHEAEIPSEFTEKYTDKDKEQVPEVIAWLNKHRKSPGWLSTAASIHRSTLTPILKGKYAGVPGKYLKKAIDTMRHIDARASMRDTPFIETSVSRIVKTACSRARQMNSFAIITAEVGTGKTRTLREYQLDNANTFMVEAHPMMSAGALLDNLIYLLHIKSISNKVTRETKLIAVTQALKEIKSPLIILDEAETVHAKTLEHLRRIRDNAGVGVVISGTPRLHTLISPHGGQFDQIRSRTCFWPKPIRSITRIDCQAILTATFDDRPEAFDAEGDLQKALLSAFWHYSKGSMRILVENLVPAIRDYGFKQHDALTADLVHAVAKDVLSLEG